MWRKSLQQLVVIVRRQPKNQQAWDELWKRFLVLVYPVLASFRGWIRRVAEEAIADALLHRIIPNYLKFDGTANQFEAWVVVIVRRAIYDAIREARRNCLLPLNDAAVEAPHIDRTPRLEAATEEWSNTARQITDLLKQIAWEPARAVDLFAVILFWVRAGAARIGEDVETATVLTWAREWESRRIRAEFPTLAEMWQELGPLAADPMLWNSVGFQGALARYLGHYSSEPVSPNRCEQWKARAIDAGEKQAEIVNPGTWRDLIAPLIEDHRGSGQSKRRRATRRMINGETDAEVLRPGG